MHQQCHLLQVAGEVCRHGRANDVPGQGTGGREPALEEGVRRGADAGRDHEGGPRKKW